MQPRSVAEINQRVSQVQEKIKRIDRSIQQEMGRPFFERNEHLCLFLDVERKIHTAMLRELKWILDEE